MLEPQDIQPDEAAGRMAAAFRKVAVPSGPQPEVDARVRERGGLEYRPRTIKLKERVFTMSGAMKLAAAATVVVAAGVAWIVLTPAESAVAATFKEAAMAVANLKSLYIRAHMRVRPGDCFETVVPYVEFASVQITKEFGPLERWRMDKPGRVVVMDGQGTLLWIPQDRIATRGGPGSGLVLWLRPLLDPQQLLEHEWRSAAQQGSQVTMRHEQSPDGHEQIVLSVEAKAQGDFSRSDYSKNSSITESDNRRVYRFNAQTKLLEGLQVYMHTREGDVLVLYTDEVIYDRPVDPQVFVLNLPQNVNWFQEPKEPYAGQPQTPEEMTRQFFEALSREDWVEVMKFMPLSEVPDYIKPYAGLKLLGVGKAFQSGLYPGWFVPSEFVLRDGTHRKCNLAVRNDNPAKRFVWDGGL